MVRSEKKLKELAAKLAGSNKAAVITSIKELRNEEPFEGAISLLSGLYDTTSDSGTRKTIEEFCNDIKDQTARPEIIAEIRKPRSQETISMLVSSCWQSGLDYSEYIKDIAHVFLTGNYATAIECMTVIEEAAVNCTREVKQETIRMIEESPLAGLNEKSSLTLELIGILER